MRITRFGTKVTAAIAYGSLYRLITAGEYQAPRQQQSSSPWISFAQLH